MKPLLTFLALIATCLQASFTVVQATSASSSGIRCFPRFQDDPGLEASPYICIFPPGFQRASRDPEILDQSIAPEINFQDPTLPNAFKGAVDRRSLKLKPKPKSYNVAFPSGSRLLPRLY